MLVIGLTGGIGTGKTVVTDIFKSLGAPIIDADVIAHHVTAKGQPVLLSIQQHFGQDIINSQGELDRRQLRHRIFNQPSEKAWLESLLHPLIKQQISNSIKTLHAPYCIVSIPLLAETGPYPMLDRILVVNATLDLILERVTKRDQSSEAHIKQIIAAQATQAARLTMADDIIENNESLDALTSKVKQLDQFYRQLGT